MRTSKPISTISYNSPDFLINTLENLRYQRVISYYEFIVHLPDKDDKKKHIHLYIEPNKVLDTETFGYNFVEHVFTQLFVTNKQFVLLKKNILKFANLVSKYRYSSKLKPLKCINWKSSKFGDWYWYALHDKDYLKAKMLERNIFYTDKDIFTCDIDTHIYKVGENPLINYANMSDIALRDFIYNCVADGKTLKWLLKNCSVPLGKIQSVIHFYNALCPYYSPSYDLKKHQQVLQPEAIKKARKQNFNHKIEQIKLGELEPVCEDFVFTDNDILFD